MQDRVPLYPGRVVLTPVSGQANTYDMTRADQPTQEGTPLNKASLLKDATAALFGLGSDAVPDEVLSAIKTLLDETAETANSRARFVTGSYVGTGTYGSSNPNTLTFDFEPKVVFLGTAIYRTSGFPVSACNIIPWGIPGIFGLSTGSTNRLQNTFSFSGNKMSWYCTTIGDNQLNAQGCTYHYFALG